MENVYYLLIIGLICWYFIYVRKVAEFARFHANKYCQSENIQFISIARHSSKLKFSYHNGIYWLSTFYFEFSGDGESSYQGMITLKGYKVETVVMPTFRVN